MDNLREGSVLPRQPVLKTGPETGFLDHFWTEILGLFKISVRKAEQVLKTGQDLL